ncbi:uncharacterized protein LOC105700427 [Orussus abietinus]|uniref:uncharacterized protein LOC105700427 n=1 Tax=Orussus abietinus TaxID=222816 RepID=UPI000625FBE2|nr:uncharacterized protein LOC105700427 [Orussus abietinus]
MGVFMEPTVASAYPNQLLFLPCRSARTCSDSCRLEPRTSERAASSATRESSWRPGWVRGGRIPNLAWIGKDVLAWSSGLYIVFFQVSENREFLRWCSKSSTGEGASCLSGHPIFQLFAYSERVPNPRIFVHAFPSMAKLSECHRGCASKYLATAFTAHEFIISLGSYPDFPLMFWSWRTGEKVSVTNTSIQDVDRQLLRLTHSRPTQVAQMGWTSGKLSIWETNVSGKNVLLKEHPVTLPHRALATDVDWCPTSEEHLLAVVDQHGHIYLSNEDATHVYRIVLSQRCGICVEVERPEIRWFREGIVLRTTFCQIRYYRKNEKNQWRREWYLKTTKKPSNLTSHPFKHDRLFYHTFEGHMMQIDFSGNAKLPTIQRRFHYGGIYRFVEFVHPWGHHLVVVDNPRDIEVLDSFSAVQVGQLELGLMGDITGMRSHLDHPMVAVITDRGELALVGLLNPTEPRVLLRYHLQRNGLDLLKFSQSGKYLIAGVSKSGVCYCLSLTRGKTTFKIVAKAEARQDISDILLYDHHGEFKLIVLVKPRQAAFGSEVQLLELHPGEDQFSGVVRRFEMPRYFQYLWYLPGSPTSFIGTPYLSKQLWVMSLQRFKELQVTDALSCGHQVRRPRLSCDHRFVTTASFDGTVAIRTKDARSCLATMMTHHRSDLGVSRAITRPSGDMVVALGSTGTLVCMRLTKNQEEPRNSVENFYEVTKQPVDLHLENDDRTRRASEDYASLDPQVNSMLLHPLQEFPPRKEHEGKTWEEWQLEKNVWRAAEECTEKRAAILSDFAVLRKKVARMLHENEVCPEIERLPLSAFDLDKFGREQRMKMARDEREEMRLELESSCSSMDRVAAWIKSTFWDLQRTIGQSIFSIFGSTEVTNYPSVAEEPHQEDFLRWAQYSRDVFREMMEPEAFCPWRAYTSEQLEEAVGRHSRLLRHDEKKRIEALLADDEEEKEPSPEEVENLRNLEGMTTYRFVETSNYYFSQFELYSYGQLLLDCRGLENDCRRLREHFNKQFKETYYMKEREMNLVNERNERIRHVDRELRLMFGQSVPEAPVDPEWHPKEKPESIVRVLDHEVKAKPYISPSQQEILDRQAAKAERLRLLLLADDFRERALMKMMDGVLEVRWEDVIKKDVPKPRCMLEKKPDQYTAEDLLQVKKYEKDVEFLMQERERYRRLLEVDCVKINEALKESVSKFNSRVEDFVLTKLKLDAAIKQLELRIARGFLRHFFRINSFADEDSYKVQIVEKQKDMATLHEVLKTLQNSAMELRSQQDSLAARERILEKRFKGEVLTGSKAIAEMLTRHYKKRPRASPRTLVACELIELGKCAVSGNKSSHLLPESVDYLRSLDSLDTRPATLPTTVDTCQWENLTRHRRLKVDTEMRVQALASSISEAESTVEEFEKKVAARKVDIDELKNRISSLRQHRTEFDQNVELQLILKMGQVEVSRRGSRGDTDNAILIFRGDIEGVNRVILNAGNQKLVAMNRTINFRRGILFKEWEHRCLKMKIEDLQEELHCVRNVVVTRDIQVYLKRRARGYKDDKSQQHLERELELMRKSSEKVLRNWLDRLDEVEARIEGVKKSNGLLDRLVTNLNVLRCEMELKRDVPAEGRERVYQERKMSLLVQRSQLVRKLQTNYSELLALQTEHELLRLKTYPAVDFFRTLHGDPEERDVC